MNKISVNKTSIFDIIRTTVVSVIISLVLVLAFALLVNLVNIGDNVITPVNHVIKILSILIGCFIGFKDIRQGAFKGAISGLFYTLLSILVFGIISHSVKFNVMSLIDITLGIVSGTVSGILAVNLKKRKTA